MIVLANVGLLYDGTSDTKKALRKGVDLWIDGGKVHALRPHGQGEKVGPDHVTVDASAYTATPGLVDAHSHVTVLGLSPADMEKTNGIEALVWAERVLAITLVDGG